MKDDNEKIWAELKELYTLCKPLMKYMREHHTMHDRLVITEGGATIFKNNGFVPAVVSQWEPRQIDQQELC